jgi:glycosyltransferase involved in cell wall biosynthesis
LSEKSKNDKHNILQIVPALNCGGVERGTIDIAKAIHSNGDKPYILTSGGSLCAQASSIPAEIIKHKVSSKSPIKIYKNISFIENLIKNESIDLVHARSRAPAWSAYYAAKRADVPFVTTFHGIYSIRSFLKRYYNSVMTKGDRVIAVSEFVRRHMIENYNISEDKIRVIYRGVDLEYFAPFSFKEQDRIKLEDKYSISNKCPIILMPSRMTSWKGQHILIKALSEIRDQNFLCMLVGDLSKHPDYVKRLQDLIVQHKLQSRVKIFGPDIDIVSLYNLSDIIVSASIEPEAFGRTIVEAQAMEKIVIATNIGGAAETIDDSQTGFHVLPNNEKDLADKIKLALNILGTNQAEKITKDARKSVKKSFSLEKMQSDTLAVYSELL